MIDSLIVGNAPIDQVAAYDTTDVSLYNCVIMGRGYGEGTLFRCWNGTLKVFRCTIAYGNDLIGFRNKDSKGIASFQNCLISNVRHVPRSSEQVKLINIFSTDHKNGIWQIPAALRGYGAELPGSVWQMYFRYRNARAVPDGVDFNGRK
jgi:hypothetical protein